MPVLAHGSAHPASGNGDAIHHAQSSVPAPIVTAARELLTPSPVNLLLILSQPDASLVSAVVRSDEKFAIIGITEALPHSVFFSNGSKPEAALIDDRFAGQEQEALGLALAAWDTPALVLLVDQPSKALDAFRLKAVDCLVRPIGESAVRQSLGRIEEAVRARRTSSVGEKVVQLMGHSSNPVQMIGRILLRSGGRISFIRTEDVDWFEAQGDYVCIHSSGKKHLVRGKISAMEQQLPPSAFARIHRSIIVNLDRIKELQPLFYGDYAVVLTDGTRLTLSRSYRPKVLDLLSSACSA